MSDRPASVRRGLEARLQAIDKELATLSEHARALATAVGEFRHGLRRNAEARERNPGHETTREERRLRANCEASASELEATRERMDALRAQRRRILERLAGS